MTTTGTPSETGTNTGVKGDPKTETAEVDWKAKAREWEKRAKANAAAAERVTELENANASEVEKANRRAEAAEKALAEAQADSLRWKVAAKHGITDEDAELFLTGTDEDTLIKQAQRLSGRAAENRKNGNVVPGEGKTPNPNKGDELREFTKNLFSPNE